MTRKLALLASTLSTFGFMTWACTSGEVVMGPPGGTGASSQQGSAGTGNPVGSAGTTGSGNTVGSAGTTGAAGTTGTAGTTGSGGTGTAACSPSFQASTGGLVTMPAVGGGCWRGYAFTFTETPNCGSTITPKDFAACTTSCTLSASGTVGTATMTNSYCAVVGMGFSINQVGSGSPATLAPTGSGITVTFSKSAGALHFRAQLRDDSTSTGYCAEVTGASPVMIPYGSFNTKCYDTPPDGVAYAKTPFTSVQILIAGGDAATPFNMTLTSVSEY